MCGISGFMLKEGIENSILNNQLQKMNNSLIHRGPNNEGQWIDNEYCIGLAHRRLSILDLSSAGNQPMHSLSNRFVIVYNGEIYNHLDLRKEISNNYNFKGTSDTETLLACIESFGIENEFQPIAKIKEADYFLRYNLMKEENEEYLQAAKEGDLIEIADALGDMLYILCGTILKHGVQHKIEEVFEEIQRSNMSKLDENGNPIYREDGKVLKSSLYFKPDIKAILES